MADRGRLRRRPFTVVWMDELEVWPREELLLRVAEDLLDGRIDALEVSVEVRDGDQVRSEREDAVELVLRLGSPRRVDCERTRKGGEHETGGEDDPRQYGRGAPDRAQWQQDIESLARRRERGGHALVIPGGPAADREPQRRGVGVRGRRSQPQLRQEHHHEPRFYDTAGEPRRQPDEEQPVGAVRQGRQRRCSRVVELAHAGQPRGHAELAAEIDPGHRHRRDAGDQRGGQIGRPRSDRHDAASPVPGHDRAADPPLVGRAPGSGNLLDPRGGREACRAEPPRGAARERLARHPGPGDADHEPAQTVGEEGSLLDAPADLRGRDLGAVDGLASGVSLAEEAGAEKTRNGHPEDERHWCDLSRRHAPGFPGHRENSARSQSLAEEVLERP
jgi:hypothetical protein